MNSNTQATPLSPLANAFLSVFSGELPEGGKVEAPELGMTLEKISPHAFTMALDDGREYQLAIPNFTILEAANAGAYPAGRVIRDGLMTYEVLQNDAGGRRVRITYPDGDVNIYRKAN